MNEHRKIISIKPYTPAQSGDFMIHPKLGRVRLIKPSGGISFWCETAEKRRISLSPADMKRDHELPS